tara:strand:- start:257 stop:583 length:327 start_codon:yes stop_codon:yes gene_type:complete
MKIFKIITLILISILFTSCEKEDSTTTTTTSTVDDNVRYLNFTLSSNACSQVTVSVAGEGSQILNAGETISWELSPGNYTYTAICGSTQWGPETLNLIDNKGLNWDLK